MNIKALLRGEKVRLTAMTKNDSAIIAGWDDDDAFGRHLGAGPAVPRRTEDVAHWLEEAAKSPTDYVFAIRPVGADTLLGYVEIDGILWPHGVAGFSIAIGDLQHRGQGFGREALTLLMRFAFDELNLHRLQLTVFSYNTNAIALYENLGFRREGVFREFLRRDGKRYDMLLYGLLEPEWRSLVSE